MIVFISSVRRGLESERDYMPGLLRASGYESRRFEDFSAQPVPSRDACLRGVEADDVYLLLLGEHYGEPFPDTGKAPTEEEFTVAKRPGIPILVFRKKGAEPDERQRDFIARIGAYQPGRFWKEFGDNGELAVAVLTVTPCAMSPPTRRRCAGSRSPPSPWCDGGPPTRFSGTVQPPTCLCSRYTWPPPGPARCCLCPLFSRWLAVWAGQAGTLDFSARTRA